jgi:AcrR family transcriptional regulator
VPRTVDHQRRNRLLEAVTTDLVDNGLPGASLDRLAAAADTSARMLVHHFSSRHQLIELALARARQRQLEAARTALPSSPDFLSHLAAAWPWFSSSQTRRYFKLFSQVASAELTADNETLRGAMAMEWVELFRSGFAAAGCSPAVSRAHATILAAQLRGLFLDLDATGDTRRIAHAFQHFVGLLRADLPPLR